MSIEADLTLSSNFKKLLENSKIQSDKIKEKDKRLFNSKKEIEIFLKEKDLVKTLLKDKNKKHSKHLYLFSHIQQEYGKNISDSDLSEVLISLGYFPSYFKKLSLYIFNYFLILLFILFLIYSLITNTESGITTFWVIIGSVVSLFLFALNSDFFLSTLREKSR